MAVVGLDLRALDPSFKAHAGRGTGRYVSELVRAMEAESGFLKQYSIEIRKLSAQDLHLSGWQERIVGCLPAGRQTVRNQFFAGKQLSSLGVSLMHYFAHGDAPALFGPPAIVTVLDLIPLRFADLYRATKSSWRFRFARYLEQRVIKSARGLIAISEHTKRDLVDLLDIDPHKIVVTPLAVDDIFSPLRCEEEKVALKAELLSLRGITANCPTTIPILLYVGGIDPRKNVNFMIEMFEEFCGEYAGEGRPLLLIAGKIEQDDHYPDFVKKISKLRNADRVVLLGYVEDSELVGLYRAADIFLFPSLYEGFGLPVLEAMSCGCPTVALDNSAIPEVMGDVSSLLSEATIAVWVEKIKQILENSLVKNEIVSSGLKQAQLFSWKRTALLTIEAYRNFMKEKPNRE